VLRLRKFTLACALSNVSLLFNARVYITRLLFASTDFPCFIFPKTITQTSCFIVLEEKEIGDVHNIVFEQFMFLVFGRRTNIFPDYLIIIFTALSILSSVIILSSLMSK